MSRKQKVDGVDSQTPITSPPVSQKDVHELITHPSISPLPENHWGICELPAVFAWPHVERLAANAVLSFTTARYQ